MTVEVKIKSRPDAGFVAECPNLPGCKSVGSTQEQAKKKLVEAITGYLASVGESVPEQIERQLELHVHS